MPDDVLPRGNHAKLIVFFFSIPPVSPFEVSICSLSSCQSTFVLRFILDEIDPVMNWYPRVRCSLGSLACWAMASSEMSIAWLFRGCFVIAMMFVLRTKFVDLSLEIRTASFSWAWNLAETNEGQRIHTSQTNGQASVQAGNTPPLTLSLIE